MRHTLFAYFLEIISTTLKYIPRSVGYRVAQMFGVMYGLFPHSQNKALQFNLEHLLNLQGPTLKKTSLSIFKNFGVTLFDFLVPGHLTIDVPERKKIEQVREKYGGVLVLTFHMGHWELGARTMRQWGWPVTAVYQPYQNEKFKHVIESRRAEGVKFIPVGQGAAQGVRDALRRGDMVAMLGDHPFGEDGTPVHLLGRYVIWPKGPVVLAVREGAPIVVAAVFREKMGHYRAVVSDPLIAKNTSRSEVNRLVQAVARKFGLLLMQHPTQWYRFRRLEFVEKAAENGEMEGKASRLGEMSNAGV